MSSMDAHIEQGRTACSSCRQLSRTICLSTSRTGAITDTKHPVLLPELYNYDRGTRRQPPREVAFWPSTRLMVIADLQGTDSFD